MAGSPQPLKGSRTKVGSGKLEVQKAKTQTLLYNKSTPELECFCCIEAGFYLSLLAACSLQLAASRRAALSFRGRG